MVKNMNGIFKAYDVRGIYPGQIDEEAIARIGEAFAAVKKPTKIAVGRDVRTSGESLKTALINSLLRCGVDVIDIGIITTDQLYFTVGNYNLDGGISVTASHNPSEYNGLKFAMAGGAAPSSDDLENIRNWASSDNKINSSKHGTVSKLEILDDYVRHVLGYIKGEVIKPFKVLANGNFGAVDRAIDLISKELGIELETLNWVEDGSFPKGSPNPLLPENRDETVSFVKKTHPDIGVAWDADADRCFFFTDDGTFIPSCYIIALLAQEFLELSPGSKIIHDLTTAWVIDDQVKKYGGIPISNRTGHTFIKRRMREEGAVFAGESSGHYYFKDSYYADNGIVPFLLILKIMSKTEKSLGELVKPLMDAYKVSGEINFQVDDPQNVIKEIENALGKEGKVDKTDGLVVENDAWRFSVRPSNTEPLVRLNAEARDQKSLDEIVKRVLALINT